MRGENPECGADKYWTWIRIWKFGCLLTNSNRVMCDNWMSATMLGTKKTATAGIRNLNLAEMAHKSGGSRIVEQVLSVL